MEVLPVLDLLNGVVVRGVSGRRSEYLPVQSRLTTSPRAIDIAHAFRREFGFRKLYVADLDAILYQRPNWDLYRQLIDDDFQLLVDAGISDLDRALSIHQCGAEPIVGLELCPSPACLAAISNALAGQVTFSLDLQGGVPMIAPTATGWRPDPLEIAAQSVESKIDRIIVLDLGDVGTSNGGQTTELCRQLLDQFPSAKVIGGGGVRGVEDLQRFKQMGVTGMLVASALHDGRLTLAQLQSLR